MDDEVLTLVRIPIRELEQMIRNKHALPKAMIDVRLEPDYITLYFSDKDTTAIITTDNLSSSSVIVKPERRKRHARRRRNRMKTRGWDLVARMTNQKGQNCAIYKPFVEALSTPLSSVEQRATVARILRSNGNKPSEESISYFLENTLEYLNKSKRA